MGVLAIIGGTGLASMDGFKVTRREMVKTPYGAASSPVLTGTLNDQEMVFLARHGHRHTIPPHKINYRANLWALKEVGVEEVVAVGVVGGIASNCSPGTLVIPDQIIDYTHSRACTFHDGQPEGVKHIDFSYPYSESLRQSLIQAACVAKINTVSAGVYGATQGPRLDTAAEVKRMERDGCTIVGMTGMPEAVLARELGVAYASCAVVVNWAAGVKGKGVDIANIQPTIACGIGSASKLIKQMMT